MYKIIFIDPKTGKQPYRHGHRLYATEKQFERWLKHFRKPENNISHFQIQGFKIIGGKWRQIEGPKKVDPSRWLTDEIQFPRLLSEVYAMGITGNQEKQLCGSMDLTREDLYDLFERADRVWEAIKKRVTT